MKRIITLLLSILLIVSQLFCVYGEEMEKYGILSVTYSDLPKREEELRVMIKDGYVYADAIQLGTRLGYQARDINGTSLSIWNQDWDNGLPVSMTQFSYHSNKVIHTVYNKMVDRYEAPCPAIRNGKGSWIPLQYAVQILNGNILMLGDTAFVTMPEKSIVDILMEVSKEASTINFDFVKDFGYTNTEMMLQTTLTHLVNQFNGLLDLDGTAWVQTAQQFFMNSSAVDQNYARKFSELLCVKSKKELEEAIKNIETFNDYLSEDGKLGVYLKSLDEKLDDDLGNWSQICEHILGEVKKGNRNVSSYNKVYVQLEQAFDRQARFLETGGAIQEIQKRMSGITEPFDRLMTIGKAVKYASDFSRQDKYVVSAAQKTLSQSSDANLISDTMRTEILSYLKKLESNPLEYAGYKFVTEDLMELAMKETGLEKLIVKKAGGPLLAWDIASEFVPFIKNKLEASDKFELALYASLVQVETYLLYLNKINSVFSQIEHISAEDIYDVTQDCYIYLKSSYITRNAATASLMGKKEDVYEAMKPVQSAINQKIAGYMAIIKTARQDNRGMQYGFLPEDNATILESYDDGGIIRGITISEGKNNLEMQGELSKEVLLTHEFLELVSRLNDPLVMQQEENQWLAVYPTGYVYVGEMENGKRKGYGSYYTNNSERYIIYQGYWDEDKPNGEGKMESVVYTDSRDLSQNFYGNGTFIDGMADGEFKFTICRAGGKKSEYKLKPDRGNLPVLSESGGKVILGYSTNDRWRYYTSKDEYKKNCIAVPTFEMEGKESVFASDINIDW